MLFGLQVTGITIISQQLQVTLSVTNNNYVCERAMDVSFITTHVIGQFAVQLMHITRERYVESLVHAFQSFRVALNTIKLDILGCLQPGVAKPLPASL